MGRGGWKWGWDKRDKRDKWPSTTAASPLLPQRPPYRRPFPTSASMALYVQRVRARNGWDGDGGVLRNLDSIESIEWSGISMARGAFLMRKAAKAAVDSGVSPTTNFWQWAKTCLESQDCNAKQHAHFSNR